MPPEVNRMGDRDPVRGTIYLYVSSFGGMGLAYLYWFIVARLTNPDVVGVSSAAMSIAAIFLSLADLGIAQGIQRFLGSSAEENDYTVFKSYLHSSIIIIVISTASSAFLLLILGNLIQSFYGIPWSILTIIVLTIIVGNFVPLFRASLTSLLRTDYQAASAISAGLTKIIVGSLLVIIGLGAQGILLGNFAMYASSLLLMYLSTKYILPSSDTKEAEASTFKDGNYREIVEAGLPRYVPGTIQTVGTQIGILLVFGASGSLDTGYYYIALQLFAVFLLLPNTIMNLLYPYVSGVQEKAKGVIHQGIKLALIVSVPLVSAGIIYPDLLLTIMGSEYAAGSLAFQILLSSIPVLAVVNGVHSLAYSRGEYRLVLLIGLVMNVPRVALYLFLAPLLGGTGAALSYFIGSLAGIIAALLAAYVLDFKIKGRQIIALIAVPMVIGLPVAYLGLPWFIGIPVVVLTSVLIYMKTSMLLRNEVKMIMRKVLPESVLNRYERRLIAILDFIY